MPEEVLAAARAGELAELSEDPEAVAEAVRRFADGRQAASALELVSRTWRIWFSRGEIDEGAAVVAAALAASGASDPSIERVRVLYADGLFAFRAGDQERSRTRNEEALRLAQAIEDGRGECDALTGLARVALRDHDYARVIELARQARIKARADGDREAETSPLHLEAAGTRLSGDLPHARELYSESLQLNEELGADAWVAMELHNLGWVELHLDNVDAAVEHFRDREARQQGADDAYSRAWSDLNWAAIAVARRDYAEARARLRAGEDTLDTLGMALDPDDQSELDWLRGQIEAAP